MTLMQNKCGCRIPLFIIKKDFEMKLFYISFSLFLIIFDITFAQKQINTYKLSGTVIDLTANKALSKATILVSSRPETKELTGATTDEKGYFNIPNIHERYIRAKFSMVGYQSQVIDSIDLAETPGIGLIKLIQTSVVMPEVVIRSIKPMIEIKIDKQIINMDRVPGSNGTLIAVLRNSGAVEVDPKSNTLSIRGQAVKIQIDGHSFDLSQDELSTMPADMFDQAEVILSPGAKESAEGGAYILNLISKKSVLDNLNGSFGLGSSTSNRHSISTNLNYKSNKLNTFGSFSGILGGNKNTSSSNQTNYQSINLYNQTSNGNYRNDFYKVTGKLGIDYNYNEKNLFTLFANTMYYKGTSENLYDNLIRNNQAIMQYSFENRGNSDFSGYSNSVTGSYQRKFGREGHELTLDLYYVNLGIPSDNFINVFYSSKPDFPEKQHSNTDLRSNSFVFRLNYMFPFFSGNIETGYNFSTRNRENDYNSLNYSYLQNNWLDSMKLSNLFRYKEKIHALYVSYAVKSDKFEIKTGLRAEDLLTDGRQLTTNENFSKDFLNLFPNFNIAYKFNKSWQLTFNTFRRVTYPQLDYINPFRIYNGPNNYSEGNPGLEPYFISSYGLSLSQYLNVYYVQSTSLVSNVTTVLDDSISFNRYINLSSGKTYGMELNLPYYNTPSSLFHLPEFLSMCNLQFSYRYYRQNGQYINENMTYINKAWNLRSQMSLKLPYDVNGMLSFYYIPGTSNIRTKTSTLRLLSISFNRGFMDHKLKVGLSFSDILNTLKTSSESFGSNYYIISNSSVVNSRSVTISFTYMFNNFKERNDKNLDDGRDSGNN